MPSKHFKYLILGAGPTGLGAAYRLKELGITNFLVLEKNDFVGGLATSFRDSMGFTWDIGGHVQFSHYKYFDTLMHKAIQPEQWNVLQRESWAWMFQRFIPYPVQNNIRHFPKDILWNCIEEILRKDSANQKLNNFEDWIFASFGKGLADVFMLPYNHKVWAFAPNKLNYAWIGERVATLDIHRILKNIILEKDDVSWGPNKTFQFPKHGGTGNIWESIANLIEFKNIKLRANVIVVDSKSKKIKLENGEVYTFEYLLSTLPLNVLVNILDSGIHQNEIEQVSKLQFSTSNIVGLGLRGQPPPHLRTKCWMYFPEDNCPFYRTTVFSNYSNNNVPVPGKFWSLMTETSESSEKPVDTKHLIEETIVGCLNTKLIECRDDIVSTWQYRANYGYPTPGLSRDLVLNEVIPWLQSKDIFSRGRFGGWKYEVSNQDHSCMQGVEWVDFLESGKPELTYFHPSIANQERKNC